MNELFSSKLVQLLSCLSNEEQKDLRKYLESDWANSNKKLPLLYKELIKYSPSFDSPKLTKIRLHRCLYPSKKYNDKLVRNLLSELTEQIQLFLTHQRLRNNKALQQKLLVQEWIERGQTAFFEKTINQEITSLEQKQSKSAEDFRALYNYAMQWYHHPNLDFRFKLGDMLLNKATKNLIITMVKEWQGLIDERKERAKLLPETKYNWKDSENLITLLAEYQFLEEVHLEKDLTNQFSKEYFIQEVKKIKEDYTYNTLKTQKIRYMSLLNVGIALLRNEQLSKKELLDYYTFGLEKAFLLNENQLTVRSFVSIVGLYHEQNLFEEANRFVDTYIGRLALEKQKEVLYWVQGRELFKKGKTTACLNHLKENNTFKDIKDFSIELQLRVLYLQVRFDVFIEDNELEPLENYSKAFERYINRNPFLSEAIKQSFLVLIQNTRTLARVFLEGDGEKMTKTVEKISQTKGMQAYAWIKAKAQQLNKN